MSTPINYLDLAGVTNFKNELDNRYVTADSVNTIVNNAIANYKEAVVQIATAAAVYDTEGEDPTVVLGYVPDVAELTGTVKYTSTVLAAGGTVSPTNTLSLTKNGVAQDVVFTFSSNQSYATVNNSGVVTFAASESTA